MRKTAALFVLALSLLATAILVVLNPVPSPEPPPAPVLQVNTSVLPAPSIRLGDVVTVHGRLSNGYVAASSPGEISALFDLQATERPNGPRPHTAVALVVDRSGSMAGEKIRQARRAAKMLISRLDDEDQVAIVTYSSDFAVDLPLTTVRGRRNQVNRVIDEILDGGGTNLSGGLQAGLRALGRAAPMMARRLILLSDGNANQGITDPTTIGDIAADARRLGVTVSTLGVGVDFNEDLMNLIAQSAGGGYYYARDAATIASAFERELQGLKTLAARQVELSFELAPGMRIKEVFGYRTEIRGGRTVIPVGDMAGGETRRVMIRLSVDPIMAGQGTSLGVLLSHESADGRQPHEFRAELTSMATRDAAKVALGASRDVEEAFAAAHAAAARKDAAASFSSGNRQKAVRSLQNIIAHTKRTNKNLNSAALKNQVDEMQKTLGELRSYRYDSEAGKDLIKREKLRARQVFIH